MIPPTCRRAAASLFVCAFLLPGHLCAPLPIADVLASVQYVRSVKLMCVGKSYLLFLELNTSPSLRKLPAWVLQELICICHVCDPPSYAHMDLASAKETWQATCAAQDCIATRAV